MKNFSLFRNRLSENGFQAKGHRKKWINVEDSLIRLNGKWETTQAVRLIYVSEQSSGVLFLREGIYASNSGPRNIIEASSLKDNAILLTFKTLINFIYF